MDDTLYKLKAQRKVTMAEMAKQIDEALDAVFMELEYDDTKMVVVNEMVAYVADVMGFDVREAEDMEAGNYLIGLPLVFH